MPHDWANIGDVLGASLSLTDLFRRQWDFVRNSDGVTFAKDILGNAFDFTDVDQTAALAALQSHLENSTKASQGGAWRSFIAQLTTQFLKVWDREFVLTPDDRDAGPVDYEYDQVLLGQGQVQIEREVGFLAAQKRVMVDEGLFVRQNTITFGAFAKEGTTTGEITLAASAGRDYVLDGTVILECTSDIVEAVQFSVSHEIDEPLVDGTTIIKADNNLQVGKSFEDGATGVDLTVNLQSAVILTDASSVFSLLMITNPTEASTDKGRFYVKVTRQAGDVWLIELFRDSSRTTLVGSDSSLSGLAGATALTMTALSTTVLFTFDRANAAVAMPVVGNTYTTPVFDIRIPRLGERWRVSTANDEVGAFATKLARIPEFRIELNGAAAASAAFDNTVAPDITLP